MQKGLAAGVAIAVGAVVFFAVGWLFGGPDSPETLADKALHAPTEQEQEDAAVALRYCEEPDSAACLRAVLQQSEVPAVRAACIQGLRVRQDYGSVELLFEALEDPSPLVSGRAAATLTQLLGRDHSFRSTDSREKRDQTIRAMRQSWEDIQNSPMVEEYRQRNKQ